MDEPNIVYRSEAIPVPKKVRKSYKWEDKIQLVVEEREPEEEGKFGVYVVRAEGDPGSMHSPFTMCMPAGFSSKERAIEHAKGMLEEYRKAIESYEGYL